MLFSFFEKILEMFSDFRPLGWFTPLISWGEVSGRIGFRIVDQTFAVQTY